MEGRGRAPILYGGYRIFSDGSDTKGVSAIAVAIYAVR